MKLKDKVTLVTGASRGIGYAIAEKLAEEGSDLVINAVNPEGVTKAVDQLKQSFPERKIIGIPANVSLEEEVKKLYEQANTEFDSITNLVNNAGITRDNLLLRMKESDWDEVIDINLKSAFLLTKAMIRGMLKTGGRIVMISSIVGEIGNPGQVNYAASKGGMIAMGKSIARELASKKVNVNIITPGFIKTDMTDKLSEDAMKALIDSIPLQEIGEARDVANATSFLLSDEAKYITGQVIGVNGGLAM